MQSKARPGSIWAGLAIAVLPCVAQANLFVTTGQNGAQVQVDVNHPQYWTYTPSANVTGVDGGRFVMKRGSQTTADITFEIFEGTFADWGSVASLLSVTHGPSSFQQQYHPVLFQGTAIDLVAGKTYTAILSSNAPDPQAKAYFIKGGSIFLSDPQGNPVDVNPEPADPGTVPVPSPASSALAFVGLAVVGLRRLRAG